MTAILGKARHWTKLGWIAKNSLNKINLTKIGMSANCPFLPDQLGLEYGI
jgi:hypothetical protein